MLPQEIIRRKRDGHPLSEAEIGFFVRGIADGSIADGQVAAFAMAVFHRGMSEEETVALTRHMTGSGRRLHWHDLDLPGPVLDKLASIPGYRSDPDPAHFRRVVREAGCAIIGQTADLAPAVTSRTA